MKTLRDKLAGWREYLPTSKPRIQDSELTAVAEDEAQSKRLYACTVCSDKGYSVVLYDTDKQSTMVCTQCPRGNALGEMLDHERQEAIASLLRSLRREFMKNKNKDAVVVIDERLNSHG